MTNEETKAMNKRVEEIKHRAPLVGVQVANMELATAGEFKARQDLLLAALDAARPAWDHLANRLPRLQSRAGCEEHQVRKGTDQRDGVPAVQILPSVAVRLLSKEARGRDAWTFLLDREPFMPGRCGCARYDWKPVNMDVLLAEVSLSDMIEGLAQAVEEQLHGRRLGRTLQLEARAARLRAVALLVSGAVQ